MASEAPARARISSQWPSRMKTSRTRRRLVELLAVEEEGGADAEQVAGADAEHDQHRHVEDAVAQRPPGGDDERPDRIEDGGAGQEEQATVSARGRTAAAVSGAVHAHRRMAKIGTREDEADPEAVAHVADHGLHVHAGAVAHLVRHGIVGRRRRRDRRPCVRRGRVTLVCGLCRPRRASRGPRALHGTERADLPAARGCCRARTDAGGPARPGSESRRPRSLPPAAADWSAPRRSRCSQCSSPHSSPHDELRGSPPIASRPRRNRGC